MPTVRGEGAGRRRRAGAVCLTGSARLAEPCLQSRRRAGAGYLTGAVNVPEISDQLSLA